MKTSETKIVTFEMREPIPGYVLEERIGVGGYGEVWRASAPGGLKKAIKVVHGPLTDSRTDRELKAMERIRSVSHPMLLSIERFEIVQEHLIIVTELAEGSLKDRFDQCLEVGGGLPREELLGYMRDAADALDYLYEKHQLQHLDIKPENLLFVGGRIKVADFGLIKDLADKSMSLVGGLTPLYAAPEVFDGNPSRHSDQYSLAIVYQEMLTCESPFDGRTAAQLASQHLHCEPHVSMLPKHDRRIIARALAKDPQRRFPSCRAMVQDLVKAQENAAASRIRRNGNRPNRQANDSNPIPPSPKKRRPERKSNRHSEIQKTQATVRLSQAKQSTWQQLPEPTDVKTLDCVEFTPDASYRPTIYVGVGGAAMRVFRHLRRRVADGVAQFNHIPILDMLFLDVDADTIVDSAHGDEIVALNANNTLHMPLRDAREYRERSELLLEWLNRRWLYNIPRTQKTEGMRPLGRLAFIDHYSDVVDALRRGISSIMEPASIADSARIFGAEVQADAPQVVVVGATAGGASSGCLLDLGYGIRDVLHEMSLSDDYLLGLLMHCTPRRASGRDLAISNTLSFINEFSSYSSGDLGYPGEPACGIQPRMDRCPPFAQSYFVPLGEDLDDEALERQCRSVAEYLYQSTLSRSNSFFDRCRKNGNSYETGPLEKITLRSFGVSKVAGNDSRLVKSQADLICRSLMERWGAFPDQVEVSSRLADVVASEAKQKIKQKQLSLKSILVHARTILQDTLADQPEEYFRRIVRESIESGAGRASEDDSDRCGRVIATIDELILGNGKQRASTPTLRSVIDAKFRQKAAYDSKDISKWLVGLIDTPGYRLSTARLAANMVKSRFEDLLKEIKHAQEKFSKDLDRLAQRIIDETQPKLDQRGKQAPTELGLNPEAALVRFAMMRADELDFFGGAQFVRSLQEALAADLESMERLTEGLQKVASDFSSSEESDEHTAAFTFADRSTNIAQSIQRQRYQLAAELDRFLEENLFQQHHPLSRFVSSSMGQWAGLLWMMRSESERIVAQGFAEIWTGQLFGEKKLVDNEKSELGRCLDEAWPEILSLGGAQRLLFVAPKGSDDHLAAWSETVAQESGQTPNAMVGNDNTVAVCFETEGTPLRNVQAGLIGPRPDYVKLAERLHTRIDVEWPEMGE